MGCVSEGNKRCTKCCEAIHIPMAGWTRVKKHVLFEESDGNHNSRMLVKHWTQVSKRRAKKINPYLFTNGNKEYLKKAAFFTCNRLDKDLGCTVRGTDQHPWTCWKYGREGNTNNEYSPTCNIDINIIARG